MKMRASASSTCTQHSTINAQASYGALSGCVPSGTVHDHLLSCRLQLVQLAAAMLNQMQCTHLHLGYPVGQHVRACSCARCGGQGPPAASAGLKVRAKPAAWAQGRHCVGTRTVDSRQTAYSKEATVSPTSACSPRHQVLVSRRLPPHPKRAWCSEQQQRPHTGKCSCHGRPWTFQSAACAAGEAVVACNWP